MFLLNTINALAIAVEVFLDTLNIRLDGTPYIQWALSFSRACECRRQVKHFNCGIS